MLVFDKKQSTLRQARALRERGYDVVVDLQHKVRTGVLARLVRPSRRVVFVKRRGKDVWRGLMGKPLRPGVHTAELYVRALAELGVPAPDATSRHNAVRTRGRADARGRTTTVRGGTCRGCGDPRGE